MIKENHRALTHPMVAHDF